MTYDDALAREEYHLQQAMDLPLAHQIMAERHTMSSRFEKAMVEAERALVLNPNDSAGYYAMGQALSRAGRWAEATEYLKRAIRLDPHYPADYIFELGLAELGLEQYERAIVSLERAKQLNPTNEFFYPFLSAPYGLVGRRAEARSAIAKANALRAESGVRSYTLAHVDTWAFKNRGYRQRLREGLATAGVPALPPDLDFLRPEDKLGGAEIRSIAFGHTHRGELDGVQWYISRTETGQATMGGAWSDTGASVIEADTVCTHWSKYSTQCLAIYRNPRGSKEGLDEYMYINPYFADGGVRFGIVD